jgi:hypothetical protein
MLDAATAAIRMNLALLITIFLLNFSSQTKAQRLQLAGKGDVFEACDPQLNFISIIGKSILSALYLPAYAGGTHPNAFDNIHTTTG